jgi:hypothetical protein
MVGLRKSSVQGRLGLPRLRDVVIFATLARLSTEHAFTLQKRTATTLSVGQDMVSESLDRLENCLGKTLVEVGKARRPNSRPKRLSRLTEHGKIFGDLAICMARLWSYLDHDWTDPLQVDGLVKDISRLAEGWYFVENGYFRRVHRPFEPFPHLTAGRLEQAHRRDAPKLSERDRLRRRYRSSRR